jgi:oxygen-independent coproporphyrinogen-3 oxidase
MPPKSPTPVQRTLGVRTPDPRDGIGLYVHVPFCETKCPYCDFNTYGGIESMMPAYIDALDREISAWGNNLGSLPLKTVFFGGGTPSYLPEADIDRLLNTARNDFILVDGAEITLEANPGDVTVEKAGAWMKSGVNRVSIGIQSFDDGLLQLLGRRHTATEADRAFRTLRVAGFDNLSIDLMFGLPEQSIAQWKESLDRTVSLAPEHLSLYGLQLEKGTPLEAAVRLGQTASPDDDLAADMYQLAMERLDEAGYRHYEISNWAMPENESRHNLLYWKNQPYLGVGPGAHSSLFGYRFADAKSPRAYMRALGVEPDDGSRIQGGTAGLKPPLSAGVIDALPAELKPMMAIGVVETVEETTPSLALAETMMMGLRLDEGVSSAEFKIRFGAELLDVFPGVIEELTAHALLESYRDGIRLTKRGRLLGNEVFMRVVEAAEGIE